MPIVSLTTDFGVRDYYLAVMKGSLLSQRQDINIVDISHNVKNFDIVQAAFVLKNAYRSFPTGTIHLVSVNTAYSQKPCFLIFKWEDHYFIGPDNGVFSLAFPDLSGKVYELEQTDSALDIEQLFARAVAHLANGLPINEIGIPLDNIEQKISFQPVISQFQIKGSVVYIDNYENVITNISRVLFEKTRAKRPFSIYFKRFGPIQRISRSYAEVEVGETLCRFNSAGLLEIAVNSGKASSLLGLRPDDAIQIDFTE